MNRLRARQWLGDLLYARGGWRTRGQTLAILMYHAVTAKRVEDPGQESVPADLFAQHMAALRQMGVETLRLDHALALLATGALRGPAVSVVFDDGYSGIHDHALGILLQYRIPATVFLVTRWIGQSAFPWTPAALGRPLTWREVATVARAGDCAIGSHTHTHAILTRLDSTRAREELRRSCAAIEDAVGHRPTAFAYPYGSYRTFDARTRNLLTEEGFTVACTTVWGRWRPGDDPLTMKRIRVAWCDTVRELTKSVAGCYDWYRAVQRVQAWRDTSPRPTTR